MRLSSIARSGPPAVVLLALAWGPLVATAATPKKGAKYGGKVERIEDSRDPWVELKVSRSGKKLDFVGPAERCTLGGEVGFNPVSIVHGRIDAIKIAADGKFKASREYEVPNDTGHVTFLWDITVKGRFVSKDKAKGRVTFEMSVGGERSQGAVTTCGRREIDFTAKRGAKWPGYL